MRSVKVLMFESGWRVRGCRVARVEGRVVGGLWVGVGRLEGGGWRVEGWKGRVWSGRVC